MIIFAGIIPALLIIFGPTLIWLNLWSHFFFPSSLFTLLCVTLLAFIYKRAAIKQILHGIFGGRGRQAAAIILIANSVALLIVFHESMYSGSLYWVVEVGNQYSYSVEISTEYYSENYYNLNNTIIVFTITDLPEIPLYCNREQFIESIVYYSKANVLFENGSSLNPDSESTVIALFSNSLLPIGDWGYIDNLYYDKPRGGLGSMIQDPWYSRHGEEYFQFGSVSISCVGSPGWKSDISLEDGVPIKISKLPLDWGPAIIILNRNN